MSDEQSRQEDYVHYVIITRSKGELYLLDDGHGGPRAVGCDDSILNKKTESSQEEQIEEALCKSSENSVNLTQLGQLITELAKIVRLKKYKGRHTDIKRVVGQIEKEIRA